MAKITKMPGLSIINGFKGTLDFYLWKGIACVRSWPRSPGHDRAPAVQAQWAQFAFAGSYFTSLSPEVQAVWNDMAKGFPLTGRDLFTKAFINQGAVTFTE